MATDCIVVADSASLLFTALDHTIAIAVRLNLPFMIGLAQMAIDVFFLPSYKTQVVPPNFVKRLAELIGDVNDQPNHKHVYNINGANHEPLSLEVGTGFLHAVGIFKAPIIVSKPITVAYVVR